MQLAADSAFEIQFPGEQVPFTLRPGNDNIGAIFADWASDDVCYYASTKFSFIISLSNLYLYPSIYIHIYALRYIG